MLQNLKEVDVGDEEHNNGHALEPESSEPESNAGGGISCRKFLALGVGAGLYLGHRVVVCNVG